MENQSKFESAGESQLLYLASLYLTDLTSGPTLWQKDFPFYVILVVDYISSSCCAPQFLPNICAACMVARRQVETVIVSSSSPHFISLTHISDISHRLHRLSQSQSKISHQSLACTTKSCFHILPDTEAHQSALQNKEQFVSSIHNLY